MIFIVYVGYNPSFSHDSNGGVIKQPLKLGYDFYMEQHS